jgi:TolB-like protein
MKLIFTIFIFLTLSFASAKDRIAVLPFSNLDGRLEYQIYCYDLQDSLYKMLENYEQDAFELIPIDEIETVVAELNIDPSNPQYQSDVWKACKQLNANKVITGNFNFEASKFLINAYIYDVRMKLPNPKFQAKDIFKDEEEILAAIKEIFDALIPAYQK